MKRFRVTHMRHPRAVDNAVDVIEANYYKIEKDRVATFWIGSRYDNTAERIRTYFHPMVIEEEE